MYSIQFPKQLEQSLWNKLKSETFDMGHIVKILMNEEEETVKLESLEELKKEEDVYLIDHAWTFKYRDAEKTLRENEKLRERVKDVIKYAKKQEIPHIE
jgi:peroxiredoxin family protein